MDALSTLALSFVLAFLVGMERQLRKKPVGFAPYVLVTVISTALTTVAVTAFSSSQAVVVSGIITGIGFLGAGALIRYHERVFGFTTAAMIWAMAGLGMVVALADLPTIAFSYAALWVVLITDRVLEMRGLGRHIRTVTIEAKGIGSHSDIKEIIAKYRDSREESVEMNFDRGLVEYKFFVPASANTNAMVEKLSSLKDIRKIHMD